MLRLLDDQLTRLMTYMKQKGIYENPLKTKHHGISIQRGFRIRTTRTKTWGDAIRPKLEYNY
jgi:hypothetical protein